MANIKRKAAWFPHYVRKGRTKTLLRERFGNDGYSFWYTLLEILTDSDGLFMDCSKPSEWRYLCSEAFVDEETAERIIAYLIELGKVDKELWEGKRIIWVEQLAENLKGAFRRTKGGVPKKPFSESDTQPQPQRPRETDGDPETDDLPQAVADAWNETCTDFPKARVTNDARRELEILTKEIWQCKTAKEAKERAAQICAKLHQSEIVRRWSTPPCFRNTFRIEGRWKAAEEGDYDLQWGKQKAAKKPAPLEWVEADGKHRAYTYQGRTISGRVPIDAPPRPSERHFWLATETGGRWRT